MIAGMPLKPPLRAAIAAFVISRALLFVLLMIGANTIFGEKFYGTIWQTRIELHAPQIHPNLQKVAMNGDVWFYRGIALNGYERRPFSATAAANWAFFPLYPLAVRYLGVTGDFGIDGMLLSNLALLGAFALFPFVAGLPDDDAARAVFYLAFFPASDFLSLPLPESLFLLLILAAFFGAQRDRWWLAGAAGGLAALTRFAGLLLLPVLIVLAIERRTRSRAALAWLLLIPCGTALFALHLRRITGNALAFAQVQTTWGRQATPFWTPIAAFFAKPWALGVPWNFVAFNCAVSLLVLGAAVFFALRGQWAFATYTALSALLPLSSGSLQSFARYASVIFPLFIALGIAGRRPLVDRIVLAVSIAFFAWFAAMLTLRIDYAIA